MGRALGSKNRPRDVRILETLEELLTIVMILKKKIARVEKSMEVKW